jgi:hypothetical protein
MTRLLQPFLFARCRAFVLLASVLLASSLPASAASLDELQRISANGAVDLALHLFDEQAPSLTDDPQARVDWELARLEVYAAHGRWQQLLDHVVSLPPGMPDSFVLHADSYSARAMLALERTAEARVLLRKLIWGLPADASQLKPLRELVMRSYLADKSAQAAYIAMQRFVQDYGDTDANRRLLRARVLMLAGRDKLAASLLKDAPEQAARALYQQAQLRSATQPAKTVIARIRKLLDNKKLPDAQRLRLLAVLIEAAGVDKQSGLRLWAIEELFSLTRALKFDDGLYSFERNDLWQAYAEHAQNIANERQLLVGDDEAWFAAAAGFPNKPLRQRALYGWLVINAADALQRERADGLLLASLQAREQGDRVIRHLYRQGRLGDGRQASPIVRYTLIEYALRDSDIAQASALLKELSTAPQGVDPVMWHLRRARVFVLAGEVQRSESVLHRLLDTTETFSKPTLDRFMQVVFDLQTVKQHEAAYKLFDKLYTHSPDPQLQREILYWMADSRKAMEQYSEAARLYLESARSPGEDSTIDLWGQSAYYQAADVLAQGGYFADARALYTRLLGFTKDPARRSVLQRQIQQLLLLQQADATSR